MPTLPAIPEVPRPLCWQSSFIILGLPGVLRGEDRLRLGPYAGKPEKTWCTDSVSTVPSHPMTLRNASFPESRSFIALQLGDSVPAASDLVIAASSCRRSSDQVQFKFQNPCTRLLASLQVPKVSGFAHPRRGPPRRAGKGGPTLSANLSACRRERRIGDSLQLAARSTVHKHCLMNVSTAVVSRHERSVYCAVRNEQRECWGMPLLNRPS